jgi:hypothetical protein
LDGVFQDREACVASLLGGAVFDEKCLPKKDDTTESLANRLENIEMFDEMYVHVGKEEERLNASTYPQLRRCTYGVVHTEKFQVGCCSVANLYTIQ